MTPKLAKALKMHEHNIRGNRSESLLVLHRRSGGVLICKNGRIGSVQMTDLEGLSLKGNVLTHNHPWCASFSESDLVTSIMNELSEIRAVMFGNQEGQEITCRFEIMQNNQVNHSGFLHALYKQAQNQAIKDLNVKNRHTPANTWTESHEAVVNFTILLKQQTNIQARYTYISEEPDGIVAVSI